MPADEATTPALAVAVRPKEEALLRLQRQAGNRAVGRFLQRQELPEQLTGDGPSPSAGRICASSRTPVTTGPRHVDREDVLIRSVEGPCLLDGQGGYLWTVTYALPFPADADGFMIQELYMQSSQTTGGGTHFWECWRVRGGQTAPADRINSYDDRYRFLNISSAAGTAGWKRHVGVIRFYPGALPSQFGAEDPSTHFYTTDRRPDGWTGAGTRHDCYSQWDDRRGQRHFNGLVAYDGNDEIRAGDRVTDGHPRPQIAPTP